MPRIPLYLKTEKDQPRPPDPEYYLLAKNGLFPAPNAPFDTKNASFPTANTSFDTANVAFDW